MIVGSSSPLHREKRHDVVDLDALAARILERDQTLDEAARSFWFQNGSDLIKAKQLLGHGKFGQWCKAKLLYTTRKAEMLMSATKMFEPLVKSETFSHLPPLCVAYGLGARSCPPELRDEFLPRVLAGDAKAGREFQRALKEYRLAAKARSSPASAGPEVQASPPATPLIRQDVDRSRLSSTVLSATTADGDLRQETARGAALTLLVDELDCDTFNRLLEHASNAGLGMVFTPAFEADLAAAQRAGGLVRTN